MSHRARIPILTAALLVPLVLGPGGAMTALVRRNLKDQSVVALPLES